MANNEARDKQWWHINHVLIVLGNERLKMLHKIVMKLKVSHDFGSSSAVFVLCWHSVL